MSEFDPYHKWLGILAKDQPPNHYRILGLELYEGDLDVIEGAADRAMSFIRQYQSGEHAVLAAKLLNEIATARLCLLKPKSKADYDAKLKQELAISAPTGASIESGSQAIERPLRPAPAVSPKRSQSRQKKAKSSWRELAAAGFGGAVVVLLIGFLINRGANRVPTTTPNEQAIAQSNAPASEKASPESPGRPNSPTVNSTGERTNAGIANAGPGDVSPPVTMSTGEKGAGRTVAVPANTPQQADANAPGAQPPADTKAADEQQAIAAAPESYPSPNEVVAKGVWIDLLPVVRLPEYSQVGNWERRGQNLVCEPSEDARFMVPVAVRGSYELKCEFTRNNGDQHVSVVFPVGNAACALSLSLNAGAISGFNLIDGTSPEKLPADSTAAGRPGTLVNGKRYQLDIEVVQIGERVKLTTMLDGQRLVEWQGSPSQLSNSPYLMFPCLQSIGVVASLSATEIHQLALRLKSDGKGYYLGQDWANPLSDVADAPPKDAASNCVDWKGRKYFFSSKTMTFPRAQRLAAQMHGRLLTISSEEERAYIYKRLKEKDCWTSAWRRQNDHGWRDERNRPMRYFGWCPAGEPNLLPRELNTMIREKKPSDLSGLCDVSPWYENYVCIEWGEEYPAGK